MRRTQTVLGAIAIIVLALASGLVFTSGRLSPAKSARADAESALSPRANALDPNSDAEIQKWIVGGWAEISTHCRTDDGEYFAADGRYGNFSQQGYWSIAGSQLRIRVTHEFSGELGGDLDQEFIPRPSPVDYSTRLTREGQDRMTVTLGGKPVTFMRCPEARYSFEH